MSESCLYGYRGRLTVTARGYWFTAGGVKGSFGYYPHLRDATGLPVYPDTQLKGDLRQAVEWLSALDPSLAPKQLVRAVFGNPPQGSGGDETAGRLRLTDLTVTNRSRPAEGFFQVLPRISIDEDTKSVEDKMLALQECAFFNGDELGADVFLGYFRTAGERDAAVTMLLEAAHLIAGLGAGRSRGRGRGAFRLSPLDDTSRKTFAIEAADPVSAGLWTYGLTALTHFRNRMLEPGRSQVLEADSVIRPDQLRAWLAKTYHGLYTGWPTPAEMAGLDFGPLFPCHADGTPGLPAPASTKVKEGALVDDWQALAGKTAVRDPEADEQDKKNLSGVAFVTDEAAPRPIEVMTGLRFRNAIDEAFRTTGQGLFLQQYIPKGTIWSGRLRIVADTRFTRRALAILRSMGPELSGTIFEPRLTAITVAGSSPDKAPRLLTRSFPVDLSRLEAAAEGDRWRLGVEKRYSAVLRRPRRNRMVLSAGSVLTNDERDFTTVWAGFGVNQPPPKPVGHTPAPGHTRSALRLSAGEITRAQSGLLRELAHPDLMDDERQARITDWLDKLSGKDGSEFLKQILRTAGAKPEGVARADYLRAVYNELTIRKWEKRVADRKSTKESEVAS